MSPQGELIVRVACEERRVQRVEIASTRPFGAATIFVGRTPDAVVAMVPRLFSICGAAQHAAAALALSSAGMKLDRTPDALGVILETVREYFWRSLIDWPQSMDRAPDREGVAAAQRTIAAWQAEDSDAGAETRDTATLRATLACIARQRIFGMPPEAWLAQDDAAMVHAWARSGATLPAALLADLLATMPRLGSSEVPLMPDTTTEALLDTIVPSMAGEPRFAQHPTWNGTPVETGALARMRSHPLIRSSLAAWGGSVATRMVARLAELALLLQQLPSTPGDRATPWAQALQVAPGEGMGAVQTARGLLLHRASVAGDRVTAYAIVAPTEWNFHPDGALVHGLLGLDANDAARVERCAQLAVHALDPCVESRIEVLYA